MSHFSSARELAGTKFALTCVKKVHVLGVYPSAPCRLRICIPQGRIATGMYRQGAYEQEKLAKPAWDVFSHIESVHLSLAVRQCHKNYTASKQTGDYFLQGFSLWNPKTEHPRA